MVEDNESMDADESDADGEFMLALRFVGGHLADWIDIPSAIKRNLGKAMHHLFKVPVAWNDAWAADIKARSDAQMKITNATGKLMAQGGGKCPLS